jgi:hypothetical protein
VASASDPAAFVAELEDIGEAMKTASACGLGVATPNVTDSLIRDVRPALERHVAKTRNGSRRGRRATRSGGCRPRARMHMCP